MALSTALHTGQTLLSSVVAAGNSQATARPLACKKSALVEVTTVASGTGVILPPAILPAQVTIRNAGANALSVYPQSGGTIDGGSVNAAYSLAAGSSAAFWASSLTNWYSTPFASTATQEVTKLFCCLACTVVANTMAETSLFTGATGVVGSRTIPANTLVAGNLLRLTLYGSWDFTGSPTITLKFKLGTTTVLSSIHTPTAGNGASWGSGPPVQVSVLATGASGSVGGYGTLALVSTATSYGEQLVPGGSGGAYTGSGSAVTIDTTVALTMDLTVQWGAAASGNTIQILHAVLELVN
jgi:hypothetical protein